MRTEPVVHSLLAVATSASSSHNTQPWQWQAAGRVLDPYADRSRALPVTDPEGLELVISCGVALMAFAGGCRGRGRAENGGASPRRPVSAVLSATAEREVRPG